MLRIPLALVVLLSVSPATARTWIVTPDGTGDAPTIQAAIDSAAVGDDVLLTCGTFHESEIHMKSGVILRGTSADCTVLEGENGHTTLHGDTVQNVRIEDLQLVGGDYRLSVWSSQVDIARCAFRGGGADPYKGRALHCESSTLSLSECVFSGNGAAGVPNGHGGAIYCNDGGLSLEGCVFEENTVSGEYHAFGAGVYFEGNATVFIEDCVFRENTAGVGAIGHGGAIYGGHSPLIIRGCTFERNVAEASSFAEGGAILLRDAEFPVTIEDCVFLENECIHGGAVAISYGEDVLIRGCTFSGNEGYHPAGGGSALRCLYSSARVEECLFLGNDRRTIWMRGEGDVLEIDRCTFYGTQGEAIYAYVFADIRIHRSILAFGTAYFPVDCEFGDVTITCSDLYGNQGGDWVDCVADQAGLDGNFSADPQFCDPDVGDFTIHAGSPCAPPGVTGCGLIGALPVGCGPISTDEVSWGEIKAMYRIGE